ncbi:c-type cytochrome [Flectobacillus longus]|uniref:c-type cytochrome n=1 Tax=Flectobacillus longus TaxID=2984207 RepID=UPI0024B73B5F|nr:cytochrome c [Flectobacillus longus]MDI9880512.1 c-type cytochrome [Flectobacillus longus]
MKALYLYFGLLINTCFIYFFPTWGKPISQAKQIHADTTLYGFGRAVTQAEIDKIDIDVSPSGKGLPQGKGIATEGKKIFEAKCVACHGIGGTGGVGGVLVTTNDTKIKKKEKTIGNYWPFATTVFDYVRRAMPFNQPGSLSNQEVYHLTAYLLHANGIIDEKKIIDAQTLPKIEMPNHKAFVPDDRTGGSIIR